MADRSMGTSGTQPQAGRPDNQSPETGAVLAWDQPGSPGVTAFNWDGDALPAPARGALSGHSPALSLVGPEPLYEARIGDNPFVTTTRSRLLGPSFELRATYRRLG